jgi:predicted ATP-grasp superfamily ATP-dependent carboligase
MVGVMGRGEMIRRLDETVRYVRVHVMNGPLSAGEQHALGEALEGLLPIVAASLQDEEDRRAAARLLESLARRRGG